MRITAEESQRYESVWNTIGSYGEHSPGEQRAAMFLSMSGAKGLETVLDAGCGSGKGAAALARAGLLPTLQDLTFDGLVDDPILSDRPRLVGSLWAECADAERKRYDWAYCCDVLEHVPTEFTMLTCARILDRCTRGAFFAISLVPDQMGIWVGGPLHLTVQSFAWWRDRLGELGTVVECRDLLLQGVYLVRPR